MTNSYLSPDGLVGAFSSQTRGLCHPQTQPTLAPGPHMPLHTAAPPWYKHWLGSKPVRRSGCRAWIEQHLHKLGTEGMWVRIALQQ
jgi:hypothetical protein